MRGCIQEAVESLMHCVPKFRKKYIIYIYIYNFGNLVTKG